MRIHLGDVVEFLTDFHTLAKLKVELYSMSFNEHNCFYYLELLQRNKCRSK